MRKRKPIALIVLFTLIGVSINAQVHPDFTITNSVKTTPVKNQNKTGTCWSFATISFFETEALRMGKPGFDLSEMFIVKHAYTEKAKKYVKYHGKTNFSQGGQAHDVLNVIKQHGILPEEFYKGLNYGMNKHNHPEMTSMLTGMLESLVSNRGIKPTTAWLPAFETVVDTYLGKVPTEFKYDNKKYDPVKFAKEVVGIVPDDYVELTSYKEYPYYQAIDLEIPDNWSHDLYYNVPPNDLMRIMDNALSTGYSVCWDGDVSEEDFSHKDGTAVLALEESDGIILNGIENMRQQTFNNYSTTDDHLMHITGLARDKNNSVFYLTKNSWGTDRNEYGGYLYMSKWYVQLKTVAIMVHKDAIPKDLRKKLKLN